MLARTLELNKISWAIGCKLARLEPSPELDSAWGPERGRVQVRVMAQALGQVPEEVEVALVPVPEAEQLLELNWSEQAPEQVKIRAAPVLIMAVDPEQALAMALETVEPEVVTELAVQVTAAAAMAVALETEVALAMVEPEQPAEPWLPLATL
jgi:hypothetical protein